MPEDTGKTGIWDAQAAFPVLSRPPSAPQESAAKCVFGDRCRFLHDVSRYLETKPADLGPRCVLFETFGRCPYGVTCRFAGAHLGPEGQNLVQEELASDWAHRQPVRNSLNKALQQQLRKRKIRFERAELALRQLSQGQLPGPSLAGAVLEATTAEGTPGQSDCGAQQAPAGPDAGCSPSRPVQTCGPLTDEDVVRLRPCEKKRVCVPGPTAAGVAAGLASQHVPARHQLCHSCARRLQSGAWRSPTGLGPALSQPQRGGQQSWPHSAALERLGWAGGQRRRLLRAGASWLGFGGRR